MEIRALSRNREENNILLAEDDREIRQGIEIFLRGQGYKVFQAADGLEGLAILEREEIHLAIVDIMMPRMDGVTMVVKLRESYDFPVIFLSAKSEEVDKIMGLNMGGGRLHYKAVYAYGAAGPRQFPAPQVPPFSGSSGAEDKGRAGEGGARIPYPGPGAE